MIPRVRILVPLLAALAMAMLFPSRALCGPGDLTAYEPGLETFPEKAATEPTSQDPDLLVPAGPFVLQRGPLLDRTVLFPLFFHQKKKGEVSSSFLGISPLYFRYREGTTARGDVAFPLVWLFTRDDHETTVVPPFFLEKWTGDGSWRSGFAPLLFMQRTPTLDYTVVPPLAWHFETEKKKVVVVLPGYYRRKDRDVDLGVPPLFFNGWDANKGYLVAFPLVWHFENYYAEKSDTVVPPVWFGKREDGWRFYLFPLLYTRRNDEGSSFGLYPLVHWDNDGGGSRVVTPLGWYMRNEEEQKKGGGLLLYHGFRKKDFVFHGFVPLYFGWQTPSMMRRSHLVFPFVYTDQSPIHRNVSVLGLVWDWHAYDEKRTTVVLPFAAHSKDLYRENHTTWVFPTFQYTRKEGVWQFNIHPLVYTKGGDVEKTYQVAFPFWWRFTSPGKKSQLFFPLYGDFARTGEKSKHDIVVFPLYWQFARPGGTHRVVLNSWHWKGSGDGKAWRYMFFPLFGFGKDEQKNERYWRVLLGLFGYKTSEIKDTLYLFWLPIKVKDKTGSKATVPE